MRTSHLYPCETNFLSVHFSAGGHLPGRSLVLVGFLFPDYPYGFFHLEGGFRNNWYLSLCSILGKVFENPNTFAIS